MNLLLFINKYFKKNYTSITIDDITNKKIQNIKCGDILYTSISTTIKENGKKKRINKRKDIYQLKERKGNTFVFIDYKGIEYKTSHSGIKTPMFSSNKQRETTIQDLLEQYTRDEKQIEKETRLKEIKALGFNFTSLEPEEKLERLISSGIKNIWMVGPAGCGKSTISRNVATKKELPYLCISCGIGTSATEFIGYKYPERQATRFSEFYAKPSVILIDEITALDPAVAQILNAALANDEIETTTGLVHRHPECIIIATSNTFGFGCDRQYVANNQLDASTIDRFIGGILEVSYSKKFESQFDEEVVNYVNTLRKFVKEMDIRKVLSTRMIQSGHKLKYNYFMDWRDILITNWSDTEKNQLQQWADNNNVVLKLAA